MRKMEHLLIASFGIITVLVFVAMLIAGGLFHSVDTFWFREVSYLVSPYTPVNAITVPLYQMYNYYLIIFSFTLSLRMESMYAKLGSFYLILSAIIGLILVRHPMDPGGISSSAVGITHIVIALFMTFYIVVALILLSYAFKRTKRLYWLANCTTVTSIILLYAGYVTGVFALFSKSDYVGLTEKLPIGVFLVWIVLTAVGMLYSDKRIRHYIWYS